jgi:hypothetical protein
MIRKIILCIAIALPGLGLAQQPDTTSLHYSRLVEASQLKAHLTILASDAYEGRETGRKGQKMAAEYIRAEFIKLGLKPGNDTSFIQNYPLIIQKPGNIDFSINGTAYVFKKDFYTRSEPEFHDQAFESDEAIFIGYGIKDSLASYNDYKKAPDLKGSVVVIYPGEPKDKQGKYLISGTTEESKWSKDAQEKMKLAKRSGARAVFFISARDPTFATRRGIEERMKVPTEKSDKNEMLVFYLSKDMGNKLFGKNLEETVRKSGEKGKPISLRAKARIKIEIHRDEPGYSGDNVIGVLEGSSKKKEYVFVTAHYDHLGIQDGKVYNGADDDGSGTVTVLTLAKAFVTAKKEGHGPERSIVFMTVSGEEKGLLGSAWFVDHPTIPLAEIECDLNIDMIGRVDDFHANAKDYVYIIGSDKLSSELHAISEQANASHTKLKLDYTYNDVNDPNRFYYRSDHYNFAKNNIPVIFYFNGTHADYHQETDKVEKIDFNLMEKRARLVYFTLWELSNRPGRILVDSHKK